MSYRKERLWTNKAVWKLERAKLVREVRKEELWCVNPLTVASNSKGKKRLCLDLLRCINKVVKAHKFRIESTQEALQIIERNDYIFSFYLMSEYHR